MKNFLKQSREKLHPVNMIKRMNEFDERSKIINSKQAMFLMSNYSHHDISDCRVDKKSKHIKYYVQVIERKKLVLISNVGHLMEFTDQVRDLKEIPLPDCMV